MLLKKLLNQKLSILLEWPNILCGHGWLNDDIINAARLMLKEQYPQVDGLQRTALAQKLAMEPQWGEFVQVLNVSQSHWVTISTIGCEPGAINVYNSLYWQLPKHAQKVVADLMQCSVKAINVNYVDAQLQTGASDCGLFAVAFATALCSATDPNTMVFEQQDMRGHLLGCIDAGILTPFPVRGKKGRQTTES